MQAIVGAAAAFVIATAALISCGEDTNEPRDAGSSADGGMLDAAPPEADGGHDAGSADGGRGDGGSENSGTVADAGAPDAGPPPPPPTATHVMLMSGDYPYGADVAADAAGNIYVIGAGGFDTLELDPGGTLTGPPFFRFLASWTATGTFRWSRVLGAGLQQMYVVTDATSVYVAYTEGDSPSQEAVLASFALSDGAPGWTLRLTGGDSVAGGLERLGGHLYFAGHFAAPVDFGEGPVAPLAAGADGPDHDLYVARLTTAGALDGEVAVFGAKPAAGADWRDDEAIEMAVDASGVYLVGVLGGSGTFAGAPIASVDERDAVIFALDTDLHPQWARAFDGGESPEMNEVVALGDRACVTGFTDGVAIDLGGGAIGGSDAGQFVGCFAAADGAHLWSVALVGTERGYGALAATPDGSFLHASTAQAGAEGGAGPLPPETVIETVITRFAPNGTVEWRWDSFDPSAAAGTTYAHGICVDSFGAISLTGAFEGTRVFAGRTVEAGSSWGYVLHLE